MIWIVSSWLFLGPMIGMIIGQRFNNTSGGFLLGFLFGPLGWLLVCFDDKRPQCPECKGRVIDGATRCPHCGRAFQIPAGYEIDLEETARRKAAAEARQKQSEPPS